MNAETVPAAISDDYWEAVLARDARADGRFVYAVRSTRIYCRPSCPSRRPGRTQVVVFATPEAAGASGFRPCQRCKPDEPDARAALVARLCLHIDANPDEPPDLKALGALAGLSPAHLQRVFKRTTGITPRAYADARRTDRLKAGLKGEGTITGVLYASGYGSSSRLYERTDSHLGMTPTAYRRGGEGLRIGYRIAACPLGRMLVAATDAGICAVSLGDDDATLEEALRSEYPAARLERDDTGLGAWVEALLRHLGGDLPHLDLPVDVRATAFQRRVWEELRAIPYGETRTYGAIAQALGQPGASRAVGHACAVNPVCLVVPCHRVVRGDGGLGGYRWGVGRKRALLDGETGEEQDA